MQQAPMNGTATGAVYVQTNAAPNEVIAFRRAGGGSLDRIGSVATGGDGEGSPHLTSQGSVALTRDGRHLLVTNAASDDLSVFSVAADGSLSLEDATAGIAVDGKPGLRDEDLSSDGRFLYAIDADDGRIYGWSVDAEGSLEPVGSWDGLPATVAGLAAS